MTSQGPLSMIGAVELRDQLASGALSATDLARACISRIEAREAEISAWAWFDADRALREAEWLDAKRKADGPMGPLHGLPVGLKDIVDTAGIPSENGCPLDAGRVPEKDAAIVESLKAAGALIIGKTLTTELAFLHPNETRNPRDPGHTPGGSSSGSAAAVADGMIPLAVGTQTGGSVIRPASFCGITGFKPSFGAIPRRGVLMQSHSLDTPGVFARDPDGAALLADVLMKRGANRPGTSSGLFAAARADCITPPVFAFVHPPGWDKADAALSIAFGEVMDRLGDQAVAATLPDIFRDVAEQRACINLAEMAHHYRGYIEADENLLGIETREAIKEGMAIPAHEYLAAIACRDALSPALEPLFARFDAILCPAALGPPPEGLSSTGDAIFNGLWTMAGTPAVTLPLLTAPNGLPMGVQLVGPVNGDGRLLRAARWLWRWMGEQRS